MVPAIMRPFYGVDSISPRVEKTNRLRGCAS
jgi:hypothetical protein